MANDSVLFGAFIASLCGLCALAILPANNRAEASALRHFANVLVGPNGRRPCRS
jgi:hypothetical protein